jgi:hypothetical protein
VAGCYSEKSQTFLFGASALEVRVSDDRSLLCSCATKTTARNCAAISPQRPARLRDAPWSYLRVAANSLACRKCTAPVTSLKLQFQLRLTLLRGRQNVLGTIAAARRARDAVTGGLHLWPPEGPVVATRTIENEYERTRERSSSSIALLAAKETEPAPRIFPMKGPFFSASAGNKMTVARVF